MRLDVYLAQYWPERSRSQWQRALKAGQVTVNGEVVTTSKYELGEDDQVQPDMTTTPIEPIDVPIIYQDDDVVVFNKPVGLLTHAKGVAIEEYTLVDRLRELTTDGLDTNRPGIVHRLDRQTSGVMITARTTDAKHFLQKQFQDRKAKKTYLAIVRGTPKHPQAHIDLPIERNPKAPSTFRVGSNGKPAVTDYEVVATNDHYSVIRLRPVTGRTHQLRVHLAYLGTPIVGDPLYGGGKSPIDRLCLHAEQLEITLPTSRQRQIFVAPLPDDMLIFAREIGYDE